MNGCIPLFENLQDCPTNTLTTYPKELNEEAYNLYNNAFFRRISFQESRYFNFTFKNEACNVSKRLFRPINS